MENNRKCPLCHNDLDTNTSFCYHCKQFIDPVCNQVCPADQVSDEQLEQLIRIHDQARKKWNGSAGQIRMILGTCLMLAGVGALLFLMDKMSLLILIPICAVPVILGALIVVKAPQKPQQILNIPDYSEILSHTLIPGILQDCMAPIEAYEPDQGISEARIRETSPFVQKWDRCSGNHRIAGTWNSRKTELCNLILEKEDERPQDNDKEKTRYIPVFNGVWMIIQTDRTRNADLMIIPRNQDNNYTQNSIVEMDNELFNEQFCVQCTDRHEAFYTLTPVMIEKIMETAQKVQGQLWIRMMKDGRVVFAVHTGQQEIFKVHELHEKPAQIRKRFTEELKNTLNFCESILQKLK